MKINYLIDIHHYPFGMMMPGRNYSSGGYRFGFNGQEKDDEVSGTGNHNNAFYWEYDTRLGRRWNLDPKPNPSLSMYSTFANNPILYIDPLGDTTTYFNIADGTLLGVINNPGVMRYVKITVDRYTTATVTATSDPQHKFFGYLNSPSKAQGLVNEMEFDAKLAELMDGNGANYVAFETGNYKLDFTGKMVDADAMTGLNLGSNNADLGIIGSMQLKTIFDDGTSYAVESFNFTSGPYGNGPTPNNNYSISYGVDGKSNGKDVWTGSTPESGMLLNSGANGWKLRLPNFNGRSDMLIHPDCNSIGTAGCIGIRSSSDPALIKLGNFFQNYIVTQRRTLRVNFQITGNPNYGNDGRANPNTGQ